MKQAAKENPQEIVSRLKDEMQSLQEERAAILTAKGEIRDFLAARLGVEVPKVPSVVRASANNGNKKAPSSDDGRKTLIDYTAEYLQKALAKGMPPQKKGEIAVGVMEMGYTTTSSDDVFVQSVYLNAIRPLIEQGKVESIGSKPNTAYRWRK